MRITLSNYQESRRLTEEDNPFDLSHWLYFYECSVGCIGILKDWLLRAVSSALDDGVSRLSLDCVQDHALPVEIYRQMALDAYEGEQRLNHTASNREHVWRLLQGGELIAPVPPLPPRETPDAQSEPQSREAWSKLNQERHLLSLHPNGAERRKPETRAVLLLKRRSEPHSNPQNPHHRL